MYWPFGLLLDRTDKEVEIFTCPQVQYKMLQNTPLLLCQLSTYQYLK
jgi:hypothetical protein